MRRSHHNHLALAVIGAIAFVCSTAYARVSATVDRKQTAVGQPLILTVTVDGNQSAQPELPDLDDFEVYGQGTSSQMQIINGSVSSSTAHTYALVPKKQGKFTIGPITVRVGGEVFQTSPFQVDVAAAGATPKGSSNAIDSDDLFLTAKVSTLEPYVGEQVVYTLRFYQRVQLTEGALQPLEFPGLVQHQLGDKRVFDATVNGSNYNVTEFRWALFPQRPGTVSIPAAVVDCEVVVRRQQRRRSFFDTDFFGRGQTQKHQVRSNAVELKARALPPAPSDFAGLVGSFDVSAKASEKQLHVGESTTLTVSISGRGNADAISEPTIPGLDQFKTYDDKPTSSVQADQNGLAGNKTYVKGLVPLAEGTHRIGPVEIVYFDPTGERFKRTRSNAIELVALPATGKEDLRLTESMTSNSGKVTVRVLADDILPIHRKLDALNNQGVSAKSTWFFGGLLLSPVLLFFGTTAFWRRRERYANDATWRRGRNALKNAMTTLGNAVSAADVSRALRTYVGDKLDIEGGALTEEEARNLLLEASVPDSLVDEACHTLRQCDAAIYGAAKDSAPVEGLATTTRALLKQLDKAITTGGKR